MNTRIPKPCQGKRLVRVQFKSLVKDFFGLIIPYPIMDPDQMGPPRLNFEFSFNGKKP